MAFAFDAQPFDLYAEHCRQVVQETVVRQPLAQGYQQAVPVGGNADAERFAFRERMAKDHRLRLRLLATAVAQRVGQLRGQPWQAWLPGRQGVGNDEVEAAPHVLAEALQQRRQAQSLHAQPGAFVYPGQGVAALVFVFLSRIDDGPGHGGERDAVVGENQRKAQGLGRLAQGIEVARGFHVLADHHACQAGLGQSSDVTPLPLGVARYAQPGGHQQVTLAEPFGGVVEFADMRPANRAVEAAGSAQQARTEFGEGDQVADALRHVQETPGMGLQCNRPGRRQRALSPTGGQHPQCRGDRVDPAGGEH